MSAAEFRMISAGIKRLMCPPSSKCCRASKKCRRFSKIAPHRQTAATTPLFIVERKLNILAISPYQVRIRFALGKLERQHLLKTRCPSNNIAQCLNALQVAFDERINNAGEDVSVDAVLN